jgi:hypothetical protein
VLLVSGRGRKLRKKQGLFFSFVCFEKRNGSTALLPSFVLFCETKQSDTNEGLRVRLLHPQHHVHIYTPRLIGTLVDTRALL